MIARAKREMILRGGGRDQDVGDPQAGGEAEFLCRSLATTLRTLFISVRSRHMPKARWLIADTAFSGGSEAGTITPFAFPR